ncbi:hypothetical protein [Pimelobacter simplex]|uniref:Uncharacterized protein n=1 Tax=Nocardioides simplex TaxID=2045 RepID=A0A0C5XGF9_NOCSI|nr:hypothetical protein [Pimelobacter simplex]AJR18256.1 hypothetical protein KR76_00072 [Pimelobacter simplex]SFM56412.1 hypothetical protein SAMN05421671_2385 [Pimelobacter simplex]
MTTPYWIWLLIIVAGVVGSLGTLVAILLTFVRERRAGELW